MISFRATEDEKAFIDVAKNFARKKIRPRARSCEEVERVDEEIVKEIDELGFLSLELPESWGGLELPLITQVQINQALAYGDLGVVQGLPGTGDIASVIRLFPVGLEPVLTNNRVSLNGALVDATNRQEPFAEHVTVKRLGENYVISGTSQPFRLAKFADYVVVFATTVEEESVIFVLTDSEQWQVENGDYRLGLLAAGLAKLTFHNVTIPTSHVVATGEKAEALIQQVLTRLRILEAAKEVGLMEAALDYATEYTAGRKAFGQEIAKFQGVSFRIAKMAIETRIANHLVWEAAVSADREAKEAEELSLRALYRAHRSVRFVTDSAVQLLGGHGFVQEFPVEKWMRDAQAQVALFGRERDILTAYGEKLVGVKEDAVT